MHHALSLFIQKAFYSGNDSMISVLYVDDEPHLLELGRIFLERSGEFRVQTAVSAPKALELLTTRSFDAIISDYQMPEMDGISLLKTVRAEFGEIPFILFTGKGREEIVIQALNEGADFYLQKGGEPKSQFAELTHKIRQAVSQRETVLALHESKQHYQGLIQNANEAIFVVQDMTLRTFNPKLEEMTGWSEQELMSQPVTAFIHPDDRALILDYNQRRLKGEIVPLRYPFRLNRKDQTPCWVELSAFMISWDGRPSVMVFLNDITERKLAEDALRGSEEQFRNLLATMPDIVLVLRDGIIVYANQMAVETTGYTREELAGSPLVRFVAPGDKQRALQHMATRIAGETTGDYEMDMVDKGGGVRHVIVRCSPILFNQEPSVVVILDDITERERGTAALHASGKRFRELADMLPQLVYETDVQGNLTYSNRVGLEMTGYSQEDLDRGLNIIQAIAPEDRDRAIQDVRRRFEGRSPSEITHVEYHVLRKDKSTFPVTIYVSSIMVDGRIAGIRGIIVDMTERHKAEQMLRENEEKYRLVVEHSNDAIYIHANDRILFANRMASELTGYTVDELLQINLWALVHPDDCQRLKDAAQRRWTGSAVPSAFTARIVTKTGEAKEGDFFVDRVIFQGQPAILGLFRDITEQRKTEISLRESEEKYRILLHESSDPIFSFYPDGTYRYVNKAFADGVGKTVDEIIGRKIRDVFPRDEADKRYAPLSTVFSTGIEKKIEVRVPRPDGDRYYITTITPIKDDTGTVITAICSSKEITERKRAEEALRESEAKFRSYVENANEIIYSLTLDGIFSYVSPKWTELLGHETSEVIGNTIAAFVHPEDLPRCNAFVRQILLTGKKMSGVECRIRQKDGTWQWHVSTGSPIRDATGSIVAFLGTCHDITEQKRTEDALHMANRQLNILTGITRHDIHNQIFALKGYLELSKQTLGDTTKTSEYIAKKERATAAIERQIAFTKEYQDLGTAGPKWIVLDDVIPRSLPAGITLCTDVQGISIFADPMLEKVFFNLLDNSIRHGGHLTAVGVSSHESAGDLVIVWEDNGIGIPADEKEQIFDRGFGKNTGFGMFLVREILSLTGIRIRETGEPGKGARFEIVVANGAYRCHGNE
jgi:PAS domain S-box-containing protein